MRAAKCSAGERRVQRCEHAAIVSLAVSVWRAGSKLEAAVGRDGTARCSLIPPLLLLILVLILVLLLLLLISVCERWALQDVAEWTEVWRGHESS